MKDTWDVSIFVIVKIKLLMSSLSEMSTSVFQLDFFAIDSQKSAMTTLLKRLTLRDFLF